MLLDKKKKIANYLEAKRSEFSAFDLVLKDYLLGILLVRLKDLGLTRIEIHIDWLDDIKDLGIQAKFNEYLFDIQIDEEELAIGCSKTEPDCDEFFAFDKNTESEFIYNKIQNRIERIKVL